MLGIQNERELANFCKDVLEDASLTADARFVTKSLRSQNRKELKTVICDAFAKPTSEQVIQRLDQASIANAKVNDMQGVWNHSQLKARGRWTEVNTPMGRVPALVPPGAEVGAQVSMDAVPAVGEHNEAILAELGMEI